MTDTVDALIEAAVYELKKRTGGLNMGSKKFEFPKLLVALEAFIAGVGA